MKRSNLCFGILGIALSAFTFLQTARFPHDRIMNIGPGFFPRLIAVALSVFSLLLIFERPTSDKPVSAQLEKDASGIETVETWRAFVALVMTVIYAVLMTFLGFVPMTIIYLFSLMIFMKLRRWVFMAVVSVGVTLAIYIIFRTLLKISLPQGFWT